jgi:hypothetical protein
VPNVLYGYETRSGTLRRERRLRVFDKRVLKKIFEPGREKLKEERRTLFGETVRDF